MKAKFETDVKEEHFLTVLLDLQGIFELCKSV
jgi:hypothetical protein